MKKFLMSLMALVLVAGMSACSKPAENGGNETPVEYKAGTASVTTISGKDATAEKAGQVQINATVASVVLDNEGKVVYVDLDTAQNAGTFGTDGVIVAADAKDSKKVLKDAYGMKKASSIEKEWFEQAEALEAWMVGKTIEEIAGLELDEAGKTTNTDVASGCTMGVEGYVAAVVKAAENAVVVPEAVTFGAANTTTLSGKDATAEKAGSVQANTTFALVGLDAEGKVLFSLIDTDQNSGTFGADGVAATDNAVKESKKLLKDAYGMKKASAIEKEWFEQIAGLETWMAGKTVAEITGLETDEAGKTTNTDVATSCTMGVDGFIQTVEAAVNNAR